MDDITGLPKNEKILDARIFPYLISYVILGFVCQSFLVFWNIYCKGLFLTSILSERIALVVSVFVLHEFLWVLNSFYVIFDRYGFFQSFKIERPKHVEDWPSTALLKTAIMKQLISHIFVQIPSLYFLYDLFSFFGSSWDNIPSFHIGVLQIFLCAIANDFLFYSFHLILHHRWFYSGIHSVHHQFKATTGKIAKKRIKNLQLF